MEGEKRRGGRHLQQYSRQPQRFEEHGGAEGASVEEDDMNSKNQPARNYGGYRQYSREPRFEEYVGGGRPIVKEEGGRWKRNSWNQPARDHEGYRQCYSREPQSFAEHDRAGGTSVEGEGMTSRSQPARNYGGYKRGQRNMGKYVPQCHTRTTGDMGTRQSEEQRDHINFHQRTIWHSRLNKSGQNYAEGEFNIERGAKENDLESFYTAREGDTEEDDTQNDEGEAENHGTDKESDPRVKILMRYLDQLIEARDGMEDRDANESPEDFKPEDQQENTELRDSPTGSIESDAGKHLPESSTSEAASDLLNHLLKLIPDLEENRCSENQGEGLNIHIQLPTPKILRDPQTEGPNIQLPIPQNLRGHRWLVKSAQRFELGTTGYSYEGQITDQKMHGHGRLMLKYGDFITGNWDANKLVDLNSCKLNYRKKTFNIVKRYDDYLLTMYESRFVAAVTLISTDKLDFNKSIGQLKDAFFGNLRTLEILQNELKKKRQESLDRFESLLKNMTGASADPILRANTFILLQKYSSIFNTKLSDFISDQNAPSGLKNAAIDLQSHDSEYHCLSNTFRFLKLQVVQLDLRRIMAKIHTDSTEMHRNMLISMCPNSLPSLLSELQQFDHSKIFYITREDIDVFDQLALQPFFQHYKDCFENLSKRFGRTFDKLNSPTHPDPSTVVPIMSPLIEFLVRSLWEIISEIVEATDGNTCESMLRCESGNWKMKDNIKWSNEENYHALKHDISSEYKQSENKSSFYHRALEVQCKVILEMLTHLFPDRRIPNKRFDYKFRVLEQDSSQQKSGRAAGSWLQKKLQKYWKAEGLPERFRDLSDGRLVWLYILDHTIHEVFKDDSKYQDVLKQYNPLLEGHIRFIKNSPTESYESFRVLTHNVVKLVTSSAPYIRVTAEKPRVNMELDKLGVDVDILFEHISTASQNIDHNPFAFSNFRDLITEYNNYLGLRNYIEIEAAPGYFSIQLSQIMQTLMRIVENSLAKSVSTDALVGYFRCLNDFLDDFRNIDFLALWYVKTVGYYNHKALEKVENKLSTSKNCSYRVINVQKFVTEYYCPDLPPPHHYIIQIVQELLGCIKKCLDKQWESNEGQLQLVQLQTTGILLDAIRRSFMYLKEQPDYVDFNAFKKESVDPFVRLVDECSTLSDLKNRASIVKESFWYLRKMDEIDIDQAMILLRDANTGRISAKLLNCYNLYLSNYNKYIEKYTSFLSGGEGHSEGLDAVKQMLKEPRPLHFSQWAEQFKTKDIPILLAGLSAIWSILVSKDLSSTGKFLKPHCIQILCILRLLSVDQSKGIDNHLAQVLTGQGKSVILGLLSSILALTGHKVRVLCYSKYLSSRDQTDFQDFFQTFHVTDKIDYGTFEDMANNFLNPTCNGIRKPLRQLVEERVLNHTNWSKMGCVTTESKNTVLLIDEVDVFFTEHFYGNTYNPCVLAGFAGLAVAQENVWSLAKRKRFTIQEIVDRTKAFIRDETAAGNTHLSDLDAFLSKPGTFPLLKLEDGGNLRVKQYTNQTLFEEHLLRMANDALSVAAKTSEQGLNFMINSDGIICGRKSGEIYKEEWNPRSYLGYLNIFNYFSIKGSNYDHKNFQNYGYLILDTGRISYSLLPSQFRLILGVSGTLKNLGEYEKSGIKSYNIHKNTILPSFYGDSNLQFYKSAYFHYFDKEQDWLKKVYNIAVRIVHLNRAVLIFFESDLTIELFKKEYKTKFDRLNEITTNTEPNLRDTYIEEAGLPGAVTLATRGMGRGVDYKSSLSVEKHGGVHVIQTFYSADIKEEIQIKGRTARKDNKGSYEMAICREHLVKGNIIPELDATVHNYATLDEIRQKLSRERGITVADKISKSERNHKTTMEYFGLA